MTVTVSPPQNQPPVADGSTTAATEDTSSALTLTGSDPDGDALTFAVVSGPAHGTVTGAAPDLTYTPDPDYFGEDVLTFTVSDGQATSAPAVVSITVAEVNDPPVPGPDSASGSGPDRRRARRVAPDQRRAGPGERGRPDAHRHRGRHGPRHARQRVARRRGDHLHARRRLLRRRRLLLHGVRRRHHARSARPAVRGDRHRDRASRRTEPAAGGRSGIARPRRGHGDADHARRQRSRRRPAHVRRRRRPGTAR